MSVKKISQIIGIVFVVLIVGGAILALYNSANSFYESQQQEKIQKLMDESNQDQD